LELRGQAKGGDHREQDGIPSFESGGGVGDSKGVRGVGVGAGEEDAPSLREERGVLEIALRGR
jgi:hypothetical protein